ncbi:MAG TPA: M1 family aminopeptidase [Rhizomicrobium sp.]|nr:M1 family aminopeptidase [Rhizomicrobium sp.]
MKRLGFIIAAATIVCTPASAMHYEINVGISPEAHRLDATVIVREPPSERFVLHKGFVVRSVVADGKPVAFHTDPSQPSSPFTPEAAGIIADTKGAKVLEVRYGGTIDEPIAGVTMITPGLVELAGQPGAWFPLFPASADSTFRLTAALPDGFMAASNARLVSQSRADGRAIYVWTSYEPSFDIALVAAPGMHATSAGSPRVEIDYANMPAATMDKLRDALIQARSGLTAHYGETRKKAGIQVFYAPRGGYPYARPPLVLTSEGFVADDMKKEDRDAALFHWAAHELAHYWWTIAPFMNAQDWTDNCDNWLNEGLAEFSAVRLVEEQYGKAEAEKILDQFRQDAAHNKTGDAIAETKQNSPDQWLNRYEKAPLVLFAARDKFGEAKLDAFLTDLYGRYSVTRNAATAAFLDLARKDLGEEGAAFFREELYRHPAVSVGK